MLSIEQLHFQFSNQSVASSTHATLNNSQHESWLFIEHLFLKKGESLLVLGDNASGKSALAQILAGEITQYHGNVNINEKFTTLSFELEAKTLAQDRLNDRSNFMAEGIDNGRTAFDIIIDEKPFIETDLDEVVALLAITYSKSLSKYYLLEKHAKY